MKKMRLGAIKRNRRKMILKGKTVRKLVQARYQKSLEKKMHEENKILKNQQREYRSYLLLGNNKDNNNNNNKIENEKEKEPVKYDEYVSLADIPDSPYLVVRGTVLWRNLEKSWTGFKIGKRLGEDGGNPIEMDKEKKHARNVQDIQKLLRVYVDDFDRIGINRKDNKSEEER